MKYSNEWSYAEAQSVNMSETKIAELHSRIKNEEIKTCVIFKQNKIVYEHFVDDNVRETVQKVNSITKSVLSLITGIAIHNGYITDMDTRVACFFPEISASDRKGNLTIRHLLTMTSGLNWPGNKEMISSENWVNHILNSPLRNTPGEQMHYSSGDSHLLSAIIKKASGKTPLALAEEHLFTPLNIQQYEWEKDPQGLSIGGWGMWLNTYDLVKIGKMVLDNGQWNDKQLISKEWLHQASTAHTTTKIGNQSYGYHWWVSDSSNGKQPDFYYAAGRGGQYIFIVPALDLVTVFTSEYETNKGGIKPYQLFVQFILGAVVK